MFCVSDQQTNMDILTLTYDPYEYERKHHRVGHGIAKPVARHIEPGISASAAQTGHEDEHEEGDVGTRVGEELDEGRAHTAAKLLKTKLII